MGKYDGKTARIQPSGGELIAGIIEDTDSPMIAEVLRRMGYETVTALPVPDEEAAVRGAIEKAAEDGMSLMVLIGGSGGGKHYDPALAKDCTHGAMDAVLEEKYVSSLYGKNGHLWSRLLCGRIKNTLVFNVPGPFDEAKAAILAFEAVGEYASSEEISRALATAVRDTYTAGQRPRE